MRVVRAGVIVVACLVVTVTVAHAQSQSWDKQLPASKRFVVLDAFEGAAVLDKETGLVWERRPGDFNKDGTVSSQDEVQWWVAPQYCHILALGNRRGWRVPTIEELTSLADASQSTPGLPSGHPFLIEFGPYQYVWSSTINSASQAWIAGFWSQPGAPIPTFVNKLDQHLVWCVRGGSQPAVFYE